jgi:lipopolysaccharide transport system permease protein
LGDQEGGTLEFAAFLFSGMIVHGVLAECLNQSATLISSNPQYVKKIVFPLEVLPWVTVISAFFQALISLFVLMCYQLIVEGSIPWTALLLPLPFAALALVCIGVGWFVSAAAVYFKDITQVAGILTTVLFFMAPILYPKDALPQTLQPLLYINPITFVIEQVGIFCCWVVALTGAGC